MKVNTDGVLLGAAATLRENDRNILDAGTGTGVIALMLAQRMSVLLNAETAAAPCGGNDTIGIKITGIDIDGPSVQEAGENFSSSPWGHILEAKHVPLDAYVPDEPLDLIISNPPYFDSSLQAPEARRNAARHTLDDDMGLSYRTLAEYAAERLAPQGRLALVLPADRENDLRRFARSRGLFPFRILRIRTVPHRPPHRIIAEFIMTRCDCAEEELTIQEKGEYTSRYISLTKEFYIKF